MCLDWHPPKMPGLPPLKFSTWGNPIYFARRFLSWGGQSGTLTFFFKSVTYRPSLSRFKGGLVKKKNTLYVLCIRVGPQVEKSSNLHITADSTGSIHKNARGKKFDPKKNRLWWGDSIWKFGIWAFSAIFLLFLSGKNSFLYWQCQGL